MIVAVSGVRHPFEKDSQLIYFGDEVMNTALLPASNLLKESVIGAFAAGLNEQKLRLKAVEYDGREDGSPKVRPLSKGWQFCVTINRTFSARLLQGGKVKSTNFGKIFDGVVVKIYADSPAIQNQIDRHAHLRPSPNPKAEEKFFFAMKLTDAWFAAAQRGENPMRQFGINSQFRNG